MAKEIEPSEAVDDRDPNEFSDYKRGMASNADWPMAVEWDDANAGRMETATDEKMLAHLVRDAESARTFLLSVKGAYFTDPLVAVQASALSQFAMARGGKIRDVWRNALLDEVANATDTYVKMFCLDQLRWCGAADDVPRIRAICKGADDRAVLDMGEAVAGELEGR